MATPPGASNADPLDTLYGRNSVREALQAVGVTGVTVSDAQGYGRQKGHAEIYRGHEYTVNFVRKVKLEIACDESLLEMNVVDGLDFWGIFGKGGNTSGGNRV